MVKHAQSVFDHFVGLALKGLITTYRNSTYQKHTHIRQSVTFPVQEVYYTNFQYILFDLFVTIILCVENLLFLKEHRQHLMIRQGCESK